MSLRVKIRKKMHKCKHKHIFTFTIFFFWLQCDRYYTATLLIPVLANTNAKYVKATKTVD